MIRYILLVSFVLLLLATPEAKAQRPEETFTRADSLRGTLTPLRTCYDVTYYHLDVTFDIAKKYISGSNQFRFTATQNFNTLQFDLFNNLQVEKVVYKGRNLPFTREFNAVFITFPQTIRKDEKDEFTVFYDGNPTIARQAPWDGGIVFTTDSLGKPWVSTACEGIGASTWWPNKDHLSDEPDSMLISISAPDGLKNISNGRLRTVTPLGNGYTRFDWFVANPINNYNVEANIGDYVHFDDVYEGEKGRLTLDYWVLSYNLDKARKQFTANVKPMLQAFEHWMGPYPFYEDGYKLIETSYLGMEHQSGIAYGNKYRNGYLGRDLSGTGHGRYWDYIVIHESGHEWFGNSITCRDPADMWIHESFTDYSEALFIESTRNKAAAQEYIRGLRRNISNTSPLTGKYGVNNEGSADMYNKGANLLNMVRTIVNDDARWRDILRGLGATFYHQTVTAQQITGYINSRAGVDLIPTFNQYLYYNDLPTLEYREENGSLLVRWNAGARNFNMPVRIKDSEDKWVWITPGPVWKKVPVKTGGEKLTVDNNFYIRVAKV
jgi:aminopeptidase N